MDDNQPSEFFPTDADPPRKPGKKAFIIAVAAVVVIAGVIAWRVIGSSSNGTPIEQAGSSTGQQAEAALSPLDARVEQATLGRADLDQMMDAPARTIMWAVSLFGFRPPELDPETPWNPPTPEQVLSMDDPGPLYTAFVRNVPVPRSDYTVDEAIDLILDDDGEITIGVRYTRFTDAPVDNAEMFLELPE